MLSREQQIPSANCLVDGGPACLAWRRFIRGPLMLGCIILSLAASPRCNRIGASKPFHFSSTRHVLVVLLPSFNPVPSRGVVLFPPGQIRRLLALNRVSPAIQHLALIVATALLFVWFPESGPSPALDLR